jgi:hypothetical protein
VRYRLQLKDRGTAGWRNTQLIGSVADLNGHADHLEDEGYGVRLVEVARLNIHERYAAEMAAEQIEEAMGLAPDTIVVE